MDLHLALKEQIEARFQDRLENDVLLTQDALLATFEGGLAVELRYANPDEYSVAWTWGEALFRIDTAPVHPGLATFPNHFHPGDGTAVADHLTVPGRAPWDNIRGVLEALLEGGGQAAK
jgi:hypothetical protein